ncbi:helix-turn-helix domain-containing protein [Nonomuraea basaltis]|uniref:helix-turn-helix domain-containing protein n=1 Tax=Nonomuraea basaltis TaxID=2495887 RepID=UPI00110C4F43|nr:helix-turn-helix domain-containing protein [Nonomuraea basaltis]TMR89483.1 helix-turn-helix transcriptional regulator [Nonomuraea basaltis]
MNEERLAELERRIARLEDRVETAGPPRRPPDSPSLMGVLNSMRRQAEKEDELGTVGYVGAARLPGGENLYARELSLAELLSTDWAPAVDILESLGSLPRLALLGALIRQGRCTRADLQESLGGDGEQTTSGQLYHHLRALQSARLIKQRRRGDYEFAPEAVIPVLAILAAALNLATDPPLGPPIDLPEPE